MQFVFIQNYHTVYVVIPSVNDLQRGKNVCV